MPRWTPPRTALLRELVLLCWALSLWGCDRPADELAEATIASAEQHSGAAHESPGVMQQPDRSVPPEDPYAALMRGSLRALPAVPDSLDGLPEGVNAVQFEMRLLTAAMQNIIQLIADDRFEEIPDQIRQVHPSYELTHSAIRSGLYRPPINGDRIDAFVEADDIFHDELRALVRAARSRDREGVTSQMGQLTAGCVSCHSDFRFPRPTP